MPRACILAERETRSASYRWASPRHVQRRSAMPGVLSSEYAESAAVNLGYRPYRRDSGPCTSRGRCKEPKSPSLSNTKFGVAGVPGSGIVRTVDAYGARRAAASASRSDRSQSACRPDDTQPGEPLVNQSCQSRQPILKPAQLAGARSMGTRWIESLDDSRAQHLDRRAAGR
jgi:hypothetical protein